jgi:hypothetical protein
LQEEGADHQSDVDLDVAPAAPPEQGADRDGGDQKTFDSRGD